MWMKSNFHNKNFVLGFAFIMRLKATRKWPVKVSFPGPLSSSLEEGGERISWGIQCLSPSTVLPTISSNQSRDGNEIHSSFSDISFRFITGQSGTNSSRGYLGYTGKQKRTFIVNLNCFLRFWRNGEIEDDGSKMAALPNPWRKSSCGHRGSTMYTLGFIVIAQMLLKLRKWKLCPVGVSGSLQKVAFHWLAFNYPILIILLSIFPFHLQQWKNEFLSWEASKYGDVSRIHFAPNEIWVPDIALFNK